MILKSKSYNFRNLLILILIVIAMNTICFIKNTYSIEEHNKVLILYDVYKEYGKEINILREINKICLEVAENIDIVKFSAYKGDDLSKYEAVFIVNLFEDKLSYNLEQNLSTYNNEIFWIGKKSYSSFLSTNKVNYIENLSIDKNTYNPSIIYDLIYKKLNIKNKEGIYCYFGEVNPFKDLNILIEEIDYLKENGIHFFIEVPPIFKNENLKAMNRFAEVLRYAQANGGEIVLTFPTLVSLNVNGKDINERVNLGFKNYINYWIYPMALSISDYWLYRDDVKELLKKTDTIFIDSNIDIEILDFDKYSLSSYKNIIKKIDLYNKSELYNNVAINISSKLSMDEFKNKVKELLNKEIYFNDTHDIESDIKFDNLNIKSNKNGTFLNNKNVTQSYFINNDKYKLQVMGEEKKENEDVNVNLTQTNKILVIISTLIIFLFITIVLISFNIDKRKFFK